VEVSLCCGVTSRILVGRYRRLEGTSWPYYQSRPNVTMETVVCSEMLAVCSRIHDIKSQTLPSVYQTPHRKIQVAFSTTKILLSGKGMAASFYSRYSPGVVQHELTSVVSFHSRYSPGVMQHELTTVVRCSEKR
jgi:hypothetical protein